jgi:methylenetetrahydrofolate dehydrogenase (NADP+)/methenyltetrahydrofolate cyclohydrolase
MIINGNIIKEVLMEEMVAISLDVPKRVCFVQFGNDVPSQKFVQIKMKAAQQLGITADYVASDVVTTDQAVAILQEAIAKEYDGIVVQLPLPHGMDSNVIINTIPVAMDIDVLTTAGLAAFQQGRSERMSPVAAAVETILKLHKISPIDKNVVIRGKGTLVGMPVMMLFDRSDIAYSAIDKDTPQSEQEAVLKNADIIISGIGVPHSLTPDMIKEGVVLIDAGTSEQSGKLAGDIDPACANKASLYTPVPGGVGPITVACLFKNLFL